MKDKTARRCRIKFIMVVGLLLIGSVTMVDAANIAQVPKIGPGDTATAGVGKQWPTPRFVADVSGSCITDNLTGLMWAKNASLLGSGTWGTAQNNVSRMNTNSYAIGYRLCGYTDWRLPNINELKSLVNYGVGTTGLAAWLTFQGFTSVKSSYYWSSTAGGNGALNVHMNNGAVSSSSVSEPFYIWPVRGGQ